MAKMLTTQINLLKHTDCGSIPYSFQNDLEKKKIKAFRENGESYDKMLGNTQSDFSPFIYREKQIQFFTKFTYSFKLEE
mgnify:FL=1